jgi:nucleotide-binding universal stress UspA family protein
MIAAGTPVAGSTGMRKIIVGVDLSKEAEVAVAHAVDRARRTGAEVVFTMVDVIPEAPVGLGAESGTATASYHLVMKEQLDRDRRGLGELHQRWTGQGATISQLVVSGMPDEVLPKVAAETGADLIVVGSHGRTGLKRALLGSVAERVTRLAPCSVLVARGDAPSGGYRHVVVGTDFSAFAKLALRQAIAAAAPGARLDIVHCWQVVYYVGPIDAGVIPPSLEVYQHTREGIEAQGAALVAAAREGNDLDIRFHAVESPATYGVVDFARAARADLVVVGSHGRRGLRRFLLGSVAEVTARHAPCSTLIAREG